MKIDLGKVSYDGRWFDFGEARLKIRPYPASRADVAFKDGALIFLGDAASDMFSYCLEDWERVMDGSPSPNEKPLKLTAIVKKYIYDFRLGKTMTSDGVEESMADFVLRKAREITAEIEADVKN